MLTAECDKLIESEYSATDTGQLMKNMNYVPTYNIIKRY